MEAAVRGRQEWIQIALAWVVTMASISIGAFLIWRKSSRMGKGLPPGPQGWPVLGNLLSLGTKPHVSLYNLSKKYGPLMFLQFGSVPVVVASSPEMAREILRTHDQIMSSRPDTSMLRKMFYNRIDVAWSPYGQHWRYMRKICTVQLFTLLRVNQFQAMRRRETLAILHLMLKRSQQEKTVDMRVFFSSLSTNYTTQMIMNKSYCLLEGASTSPEATTFRQVLRETDDLLKAFIVSDYITVLEPFDLQGYKKRTEDVHRKMDRFLEYVIDEHRLRKKSTVENVDEDFVDLLLACPRADNEEPLSKDTIKAVLMDLLTAGSETIATTMEWILAELMKHPALMRRAQEELDSVVGKDRLVEEADIPELKYVQALVKEGLRMHTPLPLMLPHESIEDCEIAGYHIPAGTRLLVNTWGIQTDPGVWERPHEFDPVRFLNSPLDVRGQDFELLPYGSGRRICPAMNIANAALHYQLAQLLHTVTWALPGDQKSEDLDMAAAFGLSMPKAIPLTLSAKPRLADHIIYPACPT